jgi:hypothetical protein
MNEVNQKVVNSALLRGQNLCAALNTGGPAHLLLEIVETTIKGLQRLQHEIEQAGPGATFAPADPGPMGSLLAEQIMATPEEKQRWLDEVPLSWRKESDAIFLRPKLEQMPTAELRQLADGMPRRTEASQRELINWLVKHRPHLIDDL